MRLLNWMAAQVSVLALKWFFGCLVVGVLLAIVGVLVFAVFELGARVGSVHASAGLAF